MNKTAALLIIGNEILKAEVEDKNIFYIAKRLNNKGIDLLETRIITDSKQHIKDAVLELKSKYSYIFTTGGIGPTHDDITTESIAEALDLKLVQNNSICDILVSRANKKRMKVDQYYLKMAQFPKGSELIENEISQVPGFKIDNIFVMAGVPAVMHSMLSYVLSTLPKGDKHKVETIFIYTSESVIASLLPAVENSTKTQIGIYPDEQGATIKIRHQEKKKIEEAKDMIINFLTSKKIKFKL